MMNKTILMLSVSCMSFIAGADLCYASFNPYGTPPELSAAMLKSHVSTHTSHLTAAHLSSLEDFDEDDLFVTLTRSLSSDLSPLRGRGGKGTLSSSGLTRGSRLKKSAALSDLDTPVKPEYDREKRPEYDQSTSPLRGEAELRSRTGEGDNKNIQLAAACFVTDTTDCSGNEFAGNNADDDNGGVPPGGGDDYELDNDKRCIEEGYTKTSCPEGYEAVNFCPYDNRYFEYCRALCPSDYVTCEPPYYGVGEVCDGKYASCKCTPCGSGYDYTTIPEGYVQDGEACLDCDGKTKYKIKPNPCDGFMDCGSAGPEAGAESCLSGTETLYDNCKPCPNECSLDSCPSPYTCKKEECSNKYCKTGCQSGYEWNSKTQTCTEECDSSYKYACDGSGETGYGEACNGLYKSCSCTENCYTWSSSSGCYNPYQYTCSGPGAIPGSDSCNGLYSYCSCEDKTEGIYYYGDTKGCTCNENYCSLYNIYKYTCNEEHELPDEKYRCCNDMYSRCKCEEPYVWRYENGKYGCYCPEEYKYTCSADSCESPAGLVCDNKYKECSCSCGYGCGKGDTLVTEDYNTDGDTSFAIFSWSDNDGGYCRADRYSTNTGNTTAFVCIVGGIEDW